MTDTLGLTLADINVMMYEQRDALTSLTTLLVQLGSALERIAAPIIHVAPPLAPEIKIEQSAPDITEIYNLFLQSQHANTKMLDDLKKILSEERSQAQPIRSTMMAGGPRTLKLENNEGSTDTWQGGGLKVTTLNQLVPTAYDEIEMTYIGDLVDTSIYKLAGDVVATLTFTYVDDNMTRVVRS